MSEEAELSDDFKMHPCALCDVKTLKKADLIGHIIINHDIFPCDECTYYCDTKESLKSHVLIEHKKDLSSCYELNTTESELFKCTYCEYTAKTKSRMNQHENGKHNSTKMYKCQYCEFTAKYSNNVKRHENGNHLGISYKCNYCEYSAKQRGSIEDHEAAKHEGFRLNCSDCSFQSGFRQALEYHIKTQHSPSFSKPKVVKKKRNLPVGKCNECDYFSKGGVNLKLHKQAKPQMNNMYCIVLKYNTKSRDCIGIG